MVEGWKQVGKVGDLTLYMWAGTSPAPAPIVVGESESECEQRIVFPCLQKKPQQASWMLSWSDCNCDPDDEDTEPKVTSVCHGCLSALMEGLEAQEVAECNGCGLLFKPGARMVADVVRI